MFLRYLCLSLMLGKVISVLVVVLLEEKFKEEEKKKLRLCCVCLEIKKVCDVCIVECGEENCGELIEVYKKCMREMGFNI